MQDLRGCDDFGEIQPDLSDREQPATHPIHIARGGVINQQLIERVLGFGVTLLSKLGFSIIATSGTAAALQAEGLDPLVVNKLAEQKSPNILDLMKDGKVQLLINTPSGPVARVDEVKIRSEAILRSLPIVTTRSGALATANCIRYMREHPWDVKALQDFHPAGTA